MEWSIQQISRLAGTTSRTLRHYGELGLIAPCRIGANGYRYYDERALVRLQRVLLLRELGLGLAPIGEILARGLDESAALTTHLQTLRDQQQRLARQIAAVEHTIAARRGEETLMPETMFDGFDHAAYREEVEDRWGTDAYERSDTWWRSLAERDRDEWAAQTLRLTEDWASVAASGRAPGSDEAQAVAVRHVAWLRAVPGTPAADAGENLEGYVRGLADLYVADERFAAHYGGKEGAEFVRASLLAHLDRG